MRSTLSWLGLIFGTLSMVMLVKHGFDFGVSAPLAVVLDFYEVCKRSTVGLIEPLVERAVVSIFGFKPTIAPIWRDHFVVNFIVVSAYSRQTFEAGRKGLAVFQAIWGTFLATGFAIAVGVLDGHMHSARWVQNLFPVFALFFFQVGTHLFASYWHQLPTGFDSRSAYLGAALARRITFAAGAALAILILSLRLNISSSSSDVEWSAIVLPFSIVMLATYFLIRGVGQARYLNVRVFETASARLALLLFGTILGGALFLATNAGLKLAGL
jgi:hypothetical protein